MRMLIVHLLSKAPATSLPPPAWKTVSSKIGHIIMKKHFPSNIALRPFTLRASFELHKYCSSISQYQLHISMMAKHSLAGSKSESTLFNTRVHVREGSQAL